MYNMEDVVIPEKMHILNGLANKKRCVLSLNTLPQVLLNKIAMLNGNLLHWSIWYIQHSHPP